MEQWLEVTIRTASGGIDLLCAELTEAGFDSFVIDDSEQFRQFLDGARAYWDYVDEKLAARMRDLSQVRLYLSEETAEAQLAELRALLLGVQHGGRERGTQLHAALFRFARRAERKRGIKMNVGKMEDFDHNSSRLAVQ